MIRKAMQQAQRTLFSVKGKLLLAFFVLLVLPLSAFTFYATRQITNVLQEQTFTAGHKTFTEVQAGLERLEGRIENVMGILTYDNLVYRMASANPLDYPYIRQLEDARALTETFGSLKKLSGVDRIRLYVDNDFLYSKETQSVQHVEEIREDAWFASLASGALWLCPQDQPDGEKLFSLVKRVYNPNRIHEPLAVLRVDVASGQVEAPMAETQVTPHSSLLLLRGDELLLSAGEAVDGALIAALSQGARDLPKEEWNALETLYTRYFMHHDAVGATGWTLVSLIPQSDIVQVARALRLGLMGVMALCALVAYLLAYFISRGALRRLTQLEATMRRVENGAALARTEPSGRDEIGRLMEHFNAMIGRIERLMEERYQMGREIKNLELKALQAQINPHFLYNSLDLISCLAISNGVPEIAKLVSALARFYRLSLNKGRDVVPLRDEWTHAKTYMEIQAMRFPGAFLLREQVDPDALDMRIIKIVLQPILENALIHGIFEKAGKRGVLSVTIALEGGNVRIEVADDGNGMDEETLRRNFGSLEKADYGAPGGYGVRNINDRLHLAYGPEYGIRCRSVPGQGTCVTIRIPAQLYEAESENVE